MLPEVIWVESICDDPLIIETNIRETKLLSPDYKELDPDEAVACVSSCVPRASFSSKADAARSAAQ
jgi:hypothetical protein